MAENLWHCAERNAEGEDCVKILQNLLTNKTRYATDPKCGGNVEGKKSLTVRAKGRILLDVRRGNRSTHRNGAQAQKGDA